MSELEDLAKGAIDRGEDRLRGHLRIRSGPEPGLRRVLVLLPSVDSLFLLLLLYYSARLGLRGYDKHNMLILIIN